MKLLILNFVFVRDLAKAFALSAATAEIMLH